MPMTDETVADDTTTDETEEGAAEEQPETDVAAAAPDAAAAAEARETRRERRANAFAEMKREAAESRAALDAERQERQRLAEQFAEMRGRMDAQRDAGPKPEDVEKDRLKAIRGEIEEQLRLCSEGKATMDRYHDLEEERQEIIASRNARKAWQENEKNRPDPRVEAARSSLEEQFPWLATHPQARQTADGYINLLAAKGSDPRSMATWKAACALAAKDWKLGGGGSVPSDGQKKRYGGVSGNEGQGGGGESTSGRMSEEDKKIAEARYGDLSPEQAHAKWQKKIGSKMAQKTA